MLPNQHITELGLLLERAGLHHVVIAPGSRNAPLIQLFTSGASFICHSIVDERSAGYVALGMARVLGETVGVVTTSGTAVMNLGPAIAEAFYQHLPLVIFTADRPSEPIRQFNNQIIDQQAPFYNHTKGFFEMPLEPREDPELERIMEAVDELINESMVFPRGPVHVNVPLAEPLYEHLPGPFPGRETDTPFFQPERTMPVSADEPEPEGAGTFAHPVFMEPGKKLMILAGMGMYDPEVRRALEGIVSRRPCVVIAENIANLPSEWAIATPELVLAGATESELKQLLPDRVIALGGQVVSKRLKNFLQVDPGLECNFPEGDPAGFLTRLAHGLEKDPTLTGNSFLVSWKTLEKRQMHAAKNAISGASFSNLTAISEILHRVPGGWVVHLGNSSTVRYSQLVPVREDLTYFSNRGTSGIDGSLSSAVGAAMVSGDQHLLLIGDLSFVYDSNGLWNQDFPKNLRIMVLNDGGGGIFRLLEGPDRMDFFETFSVTHHPVSLELLSQAFGRSFLRVSDMEGLQHVLQQMKQTGAAPAVVEVDTTGCENSRIFKSFIQQIQ